MRAGKHLAIYNFGLFVDDYESPAVEGFRLREGANFEAATRAEGFVARSGYGEESGPPSWGPQVFPRFIDGSGFETAPSSLSLWTDIESLMAFTYDGVHSDALRHARNWNRKREWPALVLWWVDAGQTPQWAEAVERFEYLHDNGPSPRAFTFKTPFDPAGRPRTIDREKVRRIVEANRQGQADLLAFVLSQKP